MSKTVSLQALREAADNRAPGYVDAVLARAISRAEAKIVLSDADYVALREQFPPLRPGPGTTLKALLKRIGIVAQPGCACERRAHRMDKMGCDWCEANVDLICDWLQEEATKRKLPFVRTAGKLLVRLAIRSARAHEIGRPQELPRDIGK